jgi:hypothetical protein
VPRSWTTEQAVSLAPDASALKAAQGLTSARKWTLLGRDDDFVWGLAQGSGAQPYQVQIDLTEPAFKCSCPSRKFPCKHSLGLMLLFAGQPGAVPAGEKPAWVVEWSSKRAEKTTKREAKANEPATADPEAQAKRREKRQANIARGVEFLDGWLKDLARQGLAATTSAGYAFWDAAARRLIDAQTPGLARRVRGLGSVVGSAQGEERRITEIGRMYLLLAAIQRRATLPPPWQEEIDAQLGLTIDQEEVRRGNGITAAWFVGAQTVREDEQVITRTSYLFSGCGKVARTLEFSPAARPAVASVALGRWVEGELVYFPGVRNTRALWKSPPRDAPGGELEIFQLCEDLLRTYAAALAENPFSEPLPALVSLTPEQHGETWWLRDASGAALPIASEFALGWELRACSGGQPLDIAGLWDGYSFLPLTAFADGGLMQLSMRPI